jgi:hypothetical protein
MAPVSKKEIYILAGHFIMFFLLPYIPRNVLLLTDALLVRLVLLAFLIASAYVSPLVAIATFVLIALLFVERNKYKVKHLETIMSQSTSDSEAIQSIETPETAPVQPPFDVAEVKSIPFMPQADSGDDGFAPVAPTINEKVPLPTEESNDGSEKAIQQLFEWVNPNLAQTA